MEFGPWGKYPNTACNSCGTLQQNITHPSLPQKWLCFLGKIRQANDAKKGGGKERVRGALKNVQGVFETWIVRKNHAKK